MITAEQIATAGVVGAGGAGFPTHVKLSGKADTVVINAAECEPLLHKDKELIVRYPDRIAAGLQIAMELTGAKNGVVGIKKKYTHAIDILQKALTSSLSVCPLDDAYPSGDEFVLVYETLRRVIPPGGIPLAVGAVVMNVETVFNVANAAEGIPVTEKYVSVAGEVEHPYSVKVPIGAPLYSLLPSSLFPLPSSLTCVVGGAMMGYIETDLTKPVTKTTGGIIVLPKDHFIVQQKSWDWQKTQRVGRASCDQCSFCTELCPRNLLGHPIEPHRAMRSLGFNASKQSDVPGTAFCCECNLCSYYSCPEGLNPKDVCCENKRRILAEKKRWENPPFRPERAERIMPNRKTPTHRLIQRIGLAKYLNKAPLIDKQIGVSEVVIPLKQHIGAACVPVVKQGDKVSVGQPIAVRPVSDGKPALGADIHASVSGTVIEISDTLIRTVAES
ncbi:MAG: 4Fe-4S dicluster domain-containing protein [Planctomycetaceae bacterium]|jgi:Na+-translocating ferredoxin:NAD+ oxidoreductase RnfC subunit|nr:4Fe-4S dicluster domain-containing protein [Planctomycetaceae bacterium]